jgi:hypothetical protein
MRLLCRILHVDDVEELESVNSRIAVIKVKATAIISASESDARLNQRAYLKYLMSCRSCAVGRGPGCFDIKRVVASCRGTGIRIKSP